MQAILYARVSSKEQEREGFSIPAQLDLLRGYAAKNGLTIAQEFTEAQTGKQSGREQFALMMKALSKKGGPRILLVEKTDRLYRNFKDYVLLEDLMNLHGLAIHLVKEGEILTKDSQSHVKFIHGIKTLMAKNYIDNLTEEIKKGRLQKVKQGGWPCSSPYGYKMESGHLVAKDEEAAFVQAAFGLYGTGIFSLRSCSKALHEEGLQYRPGRPKIPPAELERLLKRRTYIGQLEFQGELYQGSHAPLVDLETWGKVQAAFKKDNKPEQMTTHFFRYKGIFTCGACGATVTGDIKKGKYIYYRCARSANRACQEKPVNQTVIDETVQELFSQIVIPAELREKMAQGILEMNAMKAVEEEREHREIAKLNAQIKSLRTRRRTAYEDKLAKVIDEQLFLDVTADYEAQIDRLESKIQGVKKADVNYYLTAKRLFELPERLVKCWDAATDHEKSLFLTLVFANFSLKDKKPTMTLIPPFEWIRKSRNKKMVVTARQYANLLPLLKEFHRDIDRMWAKLPA